MLIATSSDASDAFKPNLRPPGGSEYPHVIGRESDLLKFDWLDLLHVSRQFCS